MSGSAKQYVDLAGITVYDEEIKNYIAQLGPGVTYTLSQDPNDPRKIILTPSSGTSSEVTIPEDAIYLTKSEYDNITPETNQLYGITDWSPEAEEFIDDTTTSISKTWSSNKINNSLSGLDYIGLYGMTEITSTSSDLNDYTTPGTYYKNDSSFSCSHMPQGFASSVKFLLIVQKVGAENDSEVFQTFIMAGGYYTRGYSNSWGQWFEVADKDIVQNKTLKSIGTININSASDDLNSYKVPGQTYVKTGSTFLPLNVPSTLVNTDVLFLNVYKVSTLDSIVNDYIQILNVLSSDGSTSIFTRGTKNSGSTWSDWKDISKGAVSLDDLTDVDASTPANGDVLFNDGTEWVNKNIHPEVTYAEYEAMEQAGTVDPKVQYLVKDLNVSGAPIADNETSVSKLWSSNKTNTELSAKMNYTDNAVLGAKNLLPNEATSRTINGVTFTVNADGSISVSGTASANAVLQIIANDSFFENKFETGEKYILTGCPSGGSGSTYFMQTFRMPTVYDYGEGVEFTYGSTGTGKVVQIVVMSGYAISGSLTFKPMIRLATDTDDTYVPYAMTNRELTESLKVVGNILTVATSNDIEWKYADARANDTVVGFKGFVQLKRDATASENAWITIGTISKTPTWWSQNVSTKLAGTGTAGDSTYQITASGEVQFNIRAGMKTGDQYLIAGTNIL